MNYIRFNVEAPTFNAELALNQVTHKVFSAAPVLSWLTGIDRFDLFRLCAKRGWHVTQLHKENHEEPTSETLRQTLHDSFSGEHDSFSGEHAACPALPREAASDTDE